MNKAIARDMCFLQLIAFLDGRFLSCCTSACICKSEMESIPFIYALTNRHAICMSASVFVFACALQCHVWLHWWSFAAIGNCSKSYWTENPQAHSQIWRGQWKKGTRWTTSVLGFAVKRGKWTWFLHWNFFSSNIWNFPTLGTFFAGWCNATCEQRQNVQWDRLPHGIIRERDNETQLCFLLLQVLFSSLQHFCKFSTMLNTDVQSASELNMSDVNTSLFWKKWVPGDKITISSSNALCSFISLLVL